MSKKKIIIIIIYNKCTIDGGNPPGSTKATRILAYRLPGGKLKIVPAKEEKLRLPTPIRIWETQNKLRGPLMTHKTPNPWCGGHVGQLIEKEKLVDGQVMLPFTSHPPKDLKAYHNPLGDWI